MLKALISLCLLCSVLSPPTIAQDAGVKVGNQRANIGILTCTIGQQDEAQGAPVGEGRAMRCVLKPTGDGPNTLIVDWYSKLHRVNYRLAGL